MRRLALAGIGLALLASACTGSAATPSPKGGTGGTLEGPTWILASYDKAGMSTAVPDGVYASAVFKKLDVSGNGGCNVYSGPYKADGATIKVGPLASTMMACGGPQGDVETAFMAAMNSAATYTATADGLTIYDANGTATLVFKAGQPGTLTGPTWHMIAYNNGKQAVVSAEAGADVTAVFGTDGQVTGNATCNQYNGPYTAKDDTIKIGPLASTKMACPSDALNTQEIAYLTALQNAATYTIQGTHLELRDADGALMAEYQSK
jgi:heat shock protein HslJ